MIDVVAAVFRDEENRVLIAQRNLKKDHEIGRAHV